MAIITFCDIHVHVFLALSALTTQQKHPTYVEPLLVSVIYFHYHSAGLGTYVFIIVRSQFRRSLSHFPTSPTFSVLIKRRCHCVRLSACNHLMLVQAVQDPSVRSATWFILY